MKRACASSSSSRVGHRLALFVDNRDASKIWAEAVARLKLDSFCNRFQTVAEPENRENAKTVFRLQFQL
jgi:hypothetical protein